MVEYSSIWRGLMVRHILFDPRSFISVLAGMLTSFAVLVILSIAGSAYEGRVYPVVTDFKVSSIIEEPLTGSILVSGSFVKNRSCELSGVAFFANSGVGLPDYRIRLETNPFQLTDYSGAHRQKGLQEFGPWRLYVSKQIFLERTYSTVTHKCHFMYATTTHWYP